jgi:hypothetical protein
MMAGDWNTIRAIVRGRVRRLSAASDFAQDGTHPGDHESRLTRQRPDIHAIEIHVSNSDPPGARVDPNVRGRARNADVSPHGSSERTLIAESAWFAMSNRSPTSSMPSLRPGPDGEIAVTFVFPSHASIGGAALHDASRNHEWEASQVMRLGAEVAESSMAIVGVRPAMRYTRERPVSVM